MELYDEPDLGDRETKRDMLVTLLKLGPNIKTTTDLVFESLTKQENMDFGLFMFELYLAHSLKETKEFV